MSTEAMKLALEALKNSVDLVSNEAREAESYYGKYQSRLARVQGLVALEVAHQAAIKALEKVLNHCENNLDMVKQEQDMPKIGCVNHDCDKCKEQSDQDYEFHC